MSALYLWKILLYIPVLWCSVLLVGCVAGNQGYEHSEPAWNIRDIFVLLPDEAFSELHPPPSVSLRRKMMAEGFDGSNHFFDGKGVTYRLSTEKRFMSDTFLAFSNTLPGGGGVFYSIKIFTAAKAKSLIAVTRVYGERGCERSKTLFFIFAHGVWDNISEQDPLDLKGLRLDDFNDFRKYILPEQIKNNPPVHVILPVHGTDVTVVLDHQALRALDEVRDVMKSLRNDSDAMNELIARLANASDVLFQYRDFQFIRKQND